MIFRVNGSRYLLEMEEDKRVTVWHDGEGEEPGYIIIDDLSEEEAFDWLAEVLRVESQYIPVTRVE